jgi:hypothetical protein
VHVKVNVLVADSGPVNPEPDAGRGPDHAPDAVHERASVDDHLNVEAPPAVTVGGSALNEIVGAETSPPHPARPSDSAVVTARNRRATRRVMNPWIKPGAALMVSTPTARDPTRPARVWIIEPSGSATVAPWC